MKPNWIFLSHSQIQDLQIQEAQSDKEQKRTPEQIEAILFDQEPIS